MSRFGQVSVRQCAGNTDTEYKRSVWCALFISRFLTDYLVALGKRCAINIDKKISNIFYNVPCYCLGLVRPACATCWEMCWKHRRKQILNTLCNLPCFCRVSVRLACAMWWYVFWKHRYKQISNTLYNAPCFCQDSFRLACAMWWYVFWKHRYKQIFKHPV
jgi:hypothetical protein